MTAFPVAGYLTNNARTETEVKQAFEDWLAATKQLPGGTAESALVIAAGQVTPTAGFHKVDTEAAAATDDLDRIAVTNLPNGSLVALRAAAASRVVTLRHNQGGIGNMLLLNSRNVRLNDFPAVLFLRNGDNWEQVFFGGPDPTDRILNVSTFADLATVYVPPSVQTIRVLGYYAAGDGGGGDYKIVSAEPSHGGKRQLADGRWAELVPVMGAFVLPRQFGAKLDGTNDAAALLKWLEFPGAQKRGHSGRATITSGLVPVLSLTAGLDIEGNGMEIDFSAAPLNTTCLMISGTEDAALSLGGNGLRLAKSFPVTGATYVRGDFVRIYSDRIFDPADTNSETGEINEVDAVSAGSVFVWTPLEDDYLTTQFAKISRVNLIRNVKIRNLKLKGGGPVTGTPKGHIGIACFLALNPLFERLDFAGCDSNDVWLRDCVNGTIEGCWFAGAINDQGYGVSIDNACRGTRVVKNYFRYRRHAFTTSNSTATRGIPRDILVEGNDVDYSAPATDGSGGDALDTHPAAERIHFINNTVRGSTGNGINFEAVSGSIKKNTIFFAAANGIEVHNETARDGDIDVEDNTIYDAQLVGIRFSQGLRGTTSLYRGFSICSNRIIRCGSYAIYHLTAADPRNIGGRIDDNTIRAAGGAIAIYVEKLLAGSVSNNTIIDMVSASSSGITLRNPNGVTANGNTISLPSGSTGVGIFIEGSVAGEATQVTANGNTIRSPSATSSTGISLNANARNCTVVGNNLVGTTTKVNDGSGGTGGHVIADNG